MKVLTTFLILTIGSGCAATPPYSALCQPDRPDLEPLTLEEQVLVHSIKPTGPEILARIASNDLRLKSHIKLLEELITEHNKVYGSTCD